MQFLMILALFFSLVIAVFAVQNAVIVPINFVTWHFETSLVFVILVATALGALVVGLVGLFTRVKQGLQMKGLQSRSTKLSSELEDLSKDNETLQAKVQGLEERLAEAQKLLAVQVAAKSPEEAKKVQGLLASTSLSVLAEPLSIVRLPIKDHDNIRDKLGDCAGYYNLQVSEGEVTLIVNSDFWRTVDVSFPAAQVSSEYRGIFLEQELSTLGGGYLQAVLKVLGRSRVEFFVTAMHSSYQVMVKEADLEQVVKNIQNLIDSCGR